MKGITYFPLYNYYFKYLGLFLSLIGLGLLFVSDSKFEILIYAGLLIIAFAKEKTENQLTANARNEVFKGTFGFFLSVMVALNIVEALSPGFLFQPGPEIYIGLPLVLYLVVFYFSLIFKVKLDSSIALADNISGNKKLYLIWVLAIICVSFLFFIFKIN